MTPHRTAVVLAAALSLTAAPALAHKLKVFAAADGAEVSGYAYFSGGDRAQGAALTVTGPDGTVLFTGATAADGTFRFTAARRVDHTLTVDGGDGHQAQATLPAADLPPGLPGGEGNEASAAPAPAAVFTPAPAPSAEMQAMIEAAVARQVRPLREQLDAYQDQVRWHDVAGGIGTIIGLAGLAFGLTRGRGRRS